VTLGSNHSNKGSPFHRRGQAIEKTWFCVVEVLAKLTRWWICDLRSPTSDSKASTGTLAGTGPCKHGQTTVAIRNTIRWQKNNHNVLFALCLFYLINKLMSTCTSMSMSTHVHGMTSRTRPIQTWLNETIDGYRLPRQFIFKFRPIH